jgi:hypothetical protein
MIPRGFFPVLLISLILFVLPAGAHVPLGAGGNTHISTAVSIDDPAKTYVIHGILEEHGNVAYFRFSLKAGDKLNLSLMNAGLPDQVPDMVILSPGAAEMQINRSVENLPAVIEIPSSYNAHLVPGHTPAMAEYEPFTPSATYEVATYSEDIRTPGIYYVAIVSKENETRYSLASGYKEEFSPQEWILVPVSTIGIHIWEDQPVLSVIAPFLAIVVLGIILIARREQRKGSRNGLVFWLGTIAGMLYLGGAALTLTQMFRVIQVTGVQPAVVITLILSAIPAVLGIIILRLAREPAPRSRRVRISLLLIGGLGLIFWAGMIIGPVCALIAALIPDTLQGTQ